MQSSSEDRPAEAPAAGRRDASQRIEPHLFSDMSPASAPAAPLEAAASMSVPKGSPADGGLLHQTTAQYLALHFIAQKGLQPGVPPEASAIAQACDIVLSGMEGVSLKIIAIIDRDAHPGKEFALGRDALEAIGRDCLKYCGKINRVQMPVIIQVIEVENRAPKDEQKLRLGKLRRSSRFGKVVLSGWIVDARSSSVWTNLPFDGRLMGRPFIENLLRSARHEPLPKTSVLTRAPVEPILTYALLAALIGVVRLRARLCDISHERPGFRVPDAPRAWGFEPLAGRRRPMVSPSLLGLPSPQSFALGDERVLPLPRWQSFGDARRQKLARGDFSRRGARRLGRVLVDQPAEPTDCWRLRSDHGALRRHLHAELSLRKPCQDSTSISRHGNSRSLANPLGRIIWQRPCRLRCASWRSSRWGVAWDCPHPSLAAGQDFAALPKRRGVHCFMWMFSDCAFAFRRAAGLSSLRSSHPNRSAS